MAGGGPGWGSQPGWGGCWMGPMFSVLCKFSPSWSPSLPAGVGLLWTEGLCPHPPPSVPKLRPNP